MVKQMCLCVSGVAVPDRAAFRMTYFGPRSLTDQSLTSGLHRLHSHAHFPVLSRYPPLLNSPRPN